MAMNLELHRSDESIWDRTEDRLNWDSERWLLGAAAAAFRDNFAKVIAENPSIDSVDEYLGGFDSLMTLPIVLH